MHDVEHRVNPLNRNDWTFCVAPMIDWTDRHCRVFHRLLAPHARLYTEMIATGAIIHGDAARHLDFDPSEHPLALQLGGSERDALAAAARAGERWGYDEINLNCGCPSDRVQKGAFGACLMASPGLVADALKAMQDAVSVPVTVKHRIGLDEIDSYDFVRDFVGASYEQGCRVFIVHARNAILKGLSPKENREIPPLRYERAHQLKQDFPDAVIVLNGGLTKLADCLTHLDGAQALDGVMIGREAYHRPRFLSELEHARYPAQTLLSDREVVDAMAIYMEAQLSAGVPMRVLTKPLLGLFTGLPGARRWRQLLSDSNELSRHDVGLLHQAYEGVRGEWERRFEEQET